MILPLGAREGLSTALDALAKQDGERGLAHLLEAWRACRSARVADLIDALSARLAAGRTPVPDSGFHAAWMDLARRASEADVPLLLPGLMRAPLGDKLIERVRAMAVRAPDPRIAAGLMAMVNHPPATSQSIIGKLWPPIFTALETIDDGRQRDALTRRLQEPPGASMFWPQHYRRMEALLKKLSPPVEPEGLEALLGPLARSVKELDPAASPARPRAAVRAPAADPRGVVYEDPMSIEARLVCADRLLELGDPGAELILLQKRILDGHAAASDLKKERDLIRQHGERLLPPELLPVLTAKQYGFHLGFLGDCEVVFGSDAQAEALVGHPGWRTVRELHTDEVPLLTRPDLVALECVGSFDVATLVKLAGGEHVLPVTRLGPIYVNASEKDRAVLRETSAPALAHVRALEVYGGGNNVDDLRWVLEAPIAQRLTSLSLSDEIDASLVRAFEWLPRLQHIDFAGSQRRYRLERVEGRLGLWIGMKDGRVDKLMALNDHHAREIGAVIAALRPAGVTSFVLADALATPLKKALPDLAARLGIPHVPERNQPGPTGGELHLVHRGRRDRLARARAKRGRR